MTTFNLLPAVLNPKEQSSRDLRFVCGNSNHVIKSLVLEEKYPGLPVFLWRKTVISGGLLKIDIMHSTCLPFDIQRKQQLGDTAHNRETSFKLLNF